MNDSSGPALMRDSESAGPLFQLGETVATPGALAVLQKHGVVPITLLRRHQRGDWGDLTAHDRAANDMAVMDGSRILSAYVVAEEKVWVVTEATTDGGNRQSTCILLSREY